MTALDGMVVRRGDVCGEDTEWILLDEPVE